MPLNPKNMPKVAISALRAISTDVSGIVGITSTLRFPRFATAQYTTTPGALLGGLIENITPGTGGLSGMPANVTVLFVSGQGAAVQFWYNISGGTSGQSVPITAAQTASSGPGFSGGTLLCEFWGD